MNNKQHYDFLTAKGFQHKSKAEHVSELASVILNCLYLPDLSKMRVFDRERAQKFGIDFKEPANWDSLYASCIDSSSQLAYSESQEEESTALVVTIYKASPNECPTLCDYVRRYLAAWGWDVEVETEW